MPYHADRHEVLLFHGPCARGPRPARRRWRSWAGLFALSLALLGVSSATGETLRYTLDIPDNQSVTYELDLHARHAGDLSVRAVWSGKRTLAFRLDPPDEGGRTVRRSGPSPVQLEILAEADQTAAPWRLTIHSLAARGAGRGELTIELPEHPGLKLKEKARQVPGPRAETPQRPSWLEPWRTPSGASRTTADWFGKVERLRSFIVEAEQPDNCHWQSDLMQYLSASRQDSPYVSRPTRRLMRRIVDVIKAVESYRSSSDPALAGPPPKKDRLRRVWVQERETRFRELEQTLDELLFAAGGGYAPDLEGQTWPQRLVSCVTACERHFEELGSLGERRATNRDLARSQWETIRAAADAMDAMLAFGADSSIRALRGD